MRGGAQLISEPKTLHLANLAAFGSNSEDVVWKLILWWCSDGAFTK
jgi:hypothetical protein